MRDIKNLNIWKPVEKVKENEKSFLQADIAELCLGVRSFNCLKRAGCNTVKDVLICIGEDGQGLRKIRNLGSRSEAEIMEKLQDFKNACKSTASLTVEKNPTIIKPAKSIWDREVEEFFPNDLSNNALMKLKACGVKKIGDLYATNLKMEPGWYAVRELFAKIPSSR